MRNLGIQELKDLENEGLENAELGMRNAKFKEKVKDIAVVISHRDLKSLYKNIFTC